MIYKITYNNGKTLGCGIITESGYAALADGGYYEYPAGIPSSLVDIMNADVYSTLDAGSAENISSNLAVLHISGSSSVQFGDGFHFTSTYTLNPHAGGGPSYLIVHLDLSGSVDKAGVMYKQYSDPSNFQYVVVMFSSADVSIFNQYFISNANLINWTGGETRNRFGGGSYNLHHEPIDFPDMPDSGACNSGFITLYHPTEDTLDKMARYLWSSDFGTALQTSFTKLISNPMDFIVGLALYPVKIPASNESMAEAQIKAGLMPMYEPGITGTLLSAKYITNQYVVIDCGTIDMDEFYGSCLDFAPYTKMTINIPYCGNYQLNVDDIMSNIDGSNPYGGKKGGTLNLKYFLDLFSGACVAILKCGDTCLYQWTGSMAMNVPMTGNDFSNTLMSVMSAATTIAMASSTAAAASKASKEAKGAATKAATKERAAAASRELGSTLANSTASIISSMKPAVQRSGSTAGAAGFLAIQQPYIIMEKPQQAINPKEYASQIGWPSGMKKKLNTLKGYTVVESVHLENMTNTYGASMTDSELGELEDLLNGGVILSWPQ